jgi:hypothetical protein
LAGFHPIRAARQREGENPTKRELHFPLLGIIEEIRFSFGELLWR